MRKIFKSFFIASLILLIFTENFALSTVPSENISSASVFQNVDELKIDSDAVLLMENESGNILYEKNSEKVLYPASTTKIMTAILTIEKCKLNKTTTVSQNAVDSVPDGYTNAGLVAGEKLTINDLLYALMLASANEAANVLAEYISGSTEEFAKLMTEKAKDLGCKNTVFLNANGMHNEGHYSTAKDLCIIANYCFKNETFNKIMETKEYSIPATEQHPAEDRILTNTNALINPESPYYYKYSLGGKTGFTTPAGCCLVTFAQKGNVKLTCVVLNAKTSAIRFSDAITLFNYGYENCSTQRIVLKGTTIDTIEVPNATRKTKFIDIITEEDIVDYVPNNWNNNKLTYTINLNKNIKAPIYAGENVGQISYTLNGKDYTISLIAKSSAYVAHNITAYILLGFLVIILGGIFLTPRNKNKKDI